MSGSQHLEHAAGVGTPGIRVALVLASSTGGVGRHVLSVARGLVGMGHHVTVCGPSATQRRFDFRAAGARFAPVEIPAGSVPIADVAAAIRMRRVLCAVEPAVVHAHGLRAGLVSWLARRHGAPRVVTWHNQVLAAGLRGQAYGVLERAVARSAQVTLGASEDLVRRAMRLGGRDVRFGPVAAPRLGAPERSAEQVRGELDAGDRPLLLTVARLAPQKSLDVLIRAAARWRGRTPQPLVAIAGPPGPAEAELRALAASCGAPVRFLGHRTDVADLLHASDIAVVTSQWEARQLFAQEAMVAGTPLVATAVGGIPGLVGDAAVLTPAGDVQALDDAVRTLLDDPAGRAELAARAKTRAATWPAEGDTLAHVEAVYQELVGEQGEREK